MDIKIVKAEQLPEQMQTLAKQARKEGFDLLDKLIEEYQTGKNSFSRDNEYLALVYDGDKLIACGGLNQQWGDQEIEARIGRVRRCYVHPKYRQHGIGRQLLAFLEKLARPHYAALCLQTDTKNAASFYQKLNYVFVESHPNYNYFKYLV
ncbi:acetyltransferase [Acinetobacter sp. NCu2D-2]|uniref:GNAT family N-acetyltransferase n=1 Tax=Acinetobacter sp. NCu2D-2 TaxID=1608473 RepID=UPI0007CDD054|nr:GNAT family N-acetyltransferase [Acinetobacter sp. NCu2D-2]ANF81714.1 acetyltransferase [Acinetobacter sp. NCu2D-2]